MALLEEKLSETEARRYLNEHWATDAGVLRFPVNPFEIAKKLDIQVSYRTGFPDDISGLLLRDSAEEPIISAINVGRPHTHQRFTMAHELGHYALLEHTGELEKPMGFVERRSELSAAGKDPVEIFANQFAAELLMPEGAIYFYVQDGKTFTELRDIFDVSEAALKFRLKNLRPLLMTLDADLSAQGLLH